jgi:hypothetical protein
MASSFDDTWLQSNAVVEPPTAPEEFDGALDDIQRFLHYTKSNQPGPRLVAVQNFLWLCERSSLADVEHKIFPATTMFASDDENSIREAVANQVSSVINYLHGNALWGGSCFAAFWQICVALLTEKDAQIRVLCEDNVASVAACLADPLVLQPIVLPSFVSMLQDDEDAICTALRLMAEIAVHSPCQWVRDSVWPVFSEQVSPTFPPPSTSPPFHSQHSQLHSIPFSSLSRASSPRATTSKCAAPSQCTSAKSASAARLRSPLSMFCPALMRFQR